MTSPDTVRSFGDYGAVLRRRWMYPAIVIPSVLLGAIFLAYSLQPLYRSTATIILEPSSIPEDLVRSTVPSGIPDERALRTAVIGYADQQFELVRRRALSLDRLATIVEKVDPYPEMKDLDAEGKAELIWDNVTVERVDPITFEPLDKSTAFSLHYDNPHPLLAQSVAKEVAGLFLVYNQETRVERAGQTYQFLKFRADELRRNLAGLEERIATFKRSNPAGLPEDQLRNQMELDRSQRDLDIMQAQLRLAEQRESALEVQLSQLNPTLIGAVTDPRTELATLKSQLAEAERKYTPDHPMIKRLKRSIEGLAAAGNGSSPDAAAVADNPEYLRVAADLQSSRRESSAMRAQVGRAVSEIAQLRRLIASAPAVEKDYVALAREVTIAREQLEDTEKKLRDAELASVLESEAKGEQYSLIRSPGIPREPFSPNRLGLILLGTVLALALGFGLAVVADVLDPTVRSSADVTDVLGQPVLGSIALILNAEEVARRRRRLAYLAAAIAVASLIVAATVVRSVKNMERVAAETSIVSQVYPSAAS